MFKYTELFFFFFLLTRRMCREISIEQERLYKPASPSLNPVDISTAHSDFICLSESPAREKVQKDSNSHAALVPPPCVL